MNPSPTKSSLVRSLGEFALALAALAAVARVAQLAADSSVATSSTTASPFSARPVAGGPAANHPTTHPPTNAELAELYRACPLAAAIDWDTVSHSPEKAEALLPPYHETANRVLTSTPAPTEPAVPRIRYPVHIETPPSAAAIRVAQADKPNNQPTEPQNASTQSNGNPGEWLIDPKEWLTDDNKPAPPATPAPTQPAATPPARPATPTPPSPPQPQTPAPPTELTPPPKAVETPPPAAEVPTPEAPATAAPPLRAPEISLPAPESVAPEEPEPPAPSPPPPTPEQPTTPEPLAPITTTQPPASAGGYVTPSPAQTSPQAEPTSPAEETPTTQPAPNTTVVPAQPTTPSAIFAPPPTAGTSTSGPAPPAGSPPAVDPHLELFAKNAYPSARECAVCHEDVYQQWSVSAHAYAAVSPMFNKFEQRLNDLSQGTVGYFCMRCHSPVGTSLCIQRDVPLWQQPEAAREGITCVACHRVQYAYGKSNGERRIETGDIFAPVFGGIGGDGVADAIAHKEQLKVKTAPNEPGPGQNIHITGVYFQPLTRSEFCTPCHQVAVHPGIKLEVVWEQYRASPACKKGIQCQDCHMGRVPGLPAGYDCGPVAKINGKTVNDNRKKSNHIFFGPNYSIAHPGVFPFHLKSNRWTMDQWLAFDWRAGWGTKEFEDAVADGKIKVQFPPMWAEADDRLDAREIIDDNIKKLELKRDLRVQVMENGSQVEGPFFDSSLCRGQDINLHYIVTNTNEGHNLLTASLGAQPQLWANIVLIGPDGQRLWETGYVDSAGDLANIHSYDVRNKRLPFDWQLFNLQTMFLITGVKGTDREFFVPVNFDIDQLPFIRPGVQPISNINHPPFIRMESQSLAATGSRRVPYRIPGALVQQPGRYRLSFRMRSRSEPIYFMRFCLATEEMERSMNEWMIDVHPMSVEFDVR